MPIQAELEAPAVVVPVRVNHNASVTLAAVVLVDGAYFCTMPLLPDFLIKLGVAPGAPVAHWTGLLMGISPLIAAAAGPLWGKVGDRTGLWWMAIRGTGVLSLVWLASALVQSAPQLLVLRILLGFLGGYQTMVMALATHGAAEKETGGIIARVQVTQIATAALAPLAGGYLSAIAGVRSLFVASGVFCLLAVALFAGLYRNVPGERASGGGEHPKRITAIRWIAFLLFLQAMIDRSFPPAATLWAAAHAHNPLQSASMAGAILSVGAFGDGLAAWLCGRWHARRRLLLARSAVGSVICLLLSFAVSVPTLLVLRMLLSLLAGGGMTVLYRMACRLVPESTRSSDLAMLSSCALLGQGFGSMAAGTLAARSVSYPFVWNAVLFAVLLAMIQRLPVLRRL